MKIGVTFLLTVAFFVAMGKPLKVEGVETWNPSELNTAAKAIYLSAFEKEIIFEINKLRSNPAKYAADYIAPLTGNYQGKMLHYPGDKPLKTHEGARALYECVRVLRKQKPLPLVYPNPKLTLAARDHARDQGRTGRTGHYGSDHSKFRNRIERYGKWKTRIAENIAYGGISARQIIIYLLIDDGIRDRGHRTTFLHPDYKLVGVASGYHPRYEKMCVMDFASSFK